MQYQSTRSNQQVSDMQAVLQGLARDGGLFVDPQLPYRRDFDWQGCLKKNVPERTAQILSYLLPEYENMEELVHRAYDGKFETEDLTPLVQVGDRYVLELFRGPTSAFKDVALSMLPQLMVSARKKLGSPKKTMILTATSGDTGKAALQGFCDVPGISILVFYPSEGVSPIQQAQMVTQVGKNVHVCAVKGNFDDCQRGVKEAFQKLDCEDTPVQLSSANSINIGRLAPQVTYYFTAYAKLLETGRIHMHDPVNFVVPTGNFGDILAGYFARCMGLPVRKLVCASNANRVLTDFLRNGVYDRKRPFLRTSSPSMDILISSNLERLLFYASSGNEKQVSAWMEDLKNNGRYAVDEVTLSKIRELFDAGCCDESETLETINRAWRLHHVLFDPHTAVGWKVSEQHNEQPTIVLSTASPYKFPGAVLKAIGESATGDEFAQMEQINKISGVPIPKNLSGLAGKKVLHRDCISCEEMLGYVRKKMEEAQ